ncbi:hypothetical protein BDR03DRAFT_939310 [Suillus americanus]|nr:hypothetical protein BDR03DRAFT_939310 [Suillus americanus]
MKPWQTGSRQWLQGIVPHIWHYSLCSSPVISGIPGTGGLWAFVNLARVGVRNKMRLRCAVSMKFNLPFHLDLDETS